VTRLKRVLKIQSASIVLRRISIYCVAQNLGAFHQWVLRLQQGHSWLELFQQLLLERNVESTATEMVAHNTINSNNPPKRETLVFFAFAGALNVRCGLVASFNNDHFVFYIFFQLKLERLLVRCKNPSRKRSWFGGG
jgi:hypothetical protein